MIGMLPYPHQKLWVAKPDDVKDPRKTARQVWEKLTEGLPVILAIRLR